MALGSFRSTVNEVALVRVQGCLHKGSRESGRADHAQQALSQWNWIQANQPFAKDLILSDDRINFVQRVNVEFKNQSQVLPMASIADMSLANDALKLLSKC
jgi:hypothetical protein